VLTPLYPRENQDGRILDLITGQVFADKPIKILWSNSNRRSDLNGGYFPLFDQFIDVGFAAVEDVSYIGNFQQLGLW